jgi:septum formation protein
MDQGGDVYRDFIDGIFLFMKKVILASQSPRRKMLLEWAEIAFEVRVTETDEQFPVDMQVADIPIYIARNKAEAIRHTEDELVIAADTVVILDEEIIGKPKNREEAIDILSRLSGKQHRVITGVVIRNGSHEIAFADITVVTFHPLNREQIEFYVDKYKPYDKAGAYAIQEWIGVVGIHSIQGDFYNVMGLPISRVVKELQQFR